MNVLFVQLAFLPNVDDIHDFLHFAQLIDKIKIEYSSLVFGLLKEIDSAFGRNDFREDETIKLNQVITNKFLIILIDAENKLNRSCR